MSPFPISLQIVAKLYNEETALRVANAYQLATDTVKQGIDLVYERFNNK